jgi:mevalonate kinase
MEKLIEVYDKNFKEMSKTMTQEEKDAFNAQLSSMLVEIENKNKDYLDKLTAQEKAEYDVKARQRLEALKLK